MAGHAAFRSVLVVCIGNICRSPVGERVLAAGLPGLRIGSAGLHAMTGQPADTVTAEAAGRQGVDLGGHVARMLTPALGSEHDLLLVMERSHRHEIAERFPQLLGRTMLFGQWIGSGTDISDPYRRPSVIHEQTVSLIRQAGAEWVSRLGGKAG
ncbi:MAG: hypothetical protein RIR62_1471 [Pseudomonadota bacterium]|jgi:protein-tyrosine phosphatase